MTTTTIITTLPELRSAVNAAVSQLIPKKWQKQCANTYQKQRDKRNVKNLFKNVLLAYKILKCVLTIKKGIDKIT